MIYIYFFPFFPFVSVYVCASLCDFVCTASFLPFVLGFCQFWVFFSIVFSPCYHWWICFLVWLLSSFFLFLNYFLIFLFLIIIFYFNNYFILFFSFFFSFFLLFF